MRISLLNFNVVQKPQYNCIVIEGSEQVGVQKIFKPGQCNDAILIALL